ncbi:MAG: hypothetical protein ACFE9D_07800 [Promethearchaeota archaeon]
MNIWTVELTEGSKHTFIDLQAAFGQYYEVQSGWLQKLQSRIKEQSTYSVHLNLIQLTKGPQGERLQAPFLLLLVTATKLTVTFLGELGGNETAYIVGVWPEQFLQVLKEDKDAIVKLLFIITEQPQLLETADLYF